MRADHDGASNVPTFTIVLRGYDRTQVDAYLGALAAAGDPPAPPNFRIVLRGYERTQVDQFVQQALAAREAGR